MAKRSREGALKRAREKARQEKKEAKRERKESKPDEVSLPEAHENALMEEFARLSARYEANEVTQARYDTERQRIFEELGVETD